MPDEGWSFTFNYQEETEIPDSSEIRVYRAGQLPKQENLPTVENRTNKSTFASEVSD
jgi:hypothetical protein